MAKIATAGYFIGLNNRFTSPIMTFHGHDRRWVDHYIENGYGLWDPVMFWALSRTGAVWWSDPQLTDPFGLFREAAQMG